MKRIIAIATILALIVPSVTFAQNSSLWAYIAGYLKPVISSAGLQIPSLGSSGTPCVSVGTTGIFATTTCGGGGGTSTPSVGSSGYVQFASSTSGYFDGAAGFVYDTVNKFLGVNKTVPTATGHFGASTATTSTPTGFSATANFGVSGYAFGSGNKNYSIYKRIGAIYSTALTGTYTELATSNGNMSSYSPTPDYMGSGFSPTGSQSDFEIYAYFPDGTISPTGTAGNFTDDGMSSYSVSHNFSADQGNPSGVLIVDVTRNQYKVVGSISSPYNDDGSGYSSLPHGLSTVSSYTVSLSAIGDSGANRWVFRNTSTSKWTADTIQSATDNAAWTAGTPSVTPTSGPGNSLTADGTVRLGGTSNSAFGIFSKATAPAPFQNAEEIATALENYGFIGSTANLSTSRLTGSVAVTNGGTGLTTFGGTARIPFATGAGAGLQTVSTFVLPDSNRLGVGIAAPVAIGHFVGTGYPQARFGYDSSNYINFAVTSAGATTVTVAGSAPTLTFANSIGLGANSLTLTGSIASTGSRVTKGWFTDIESTNMPTVGGTSLSSTFQGLDTQLTSLAGLSYAGNGGKYIRLNAGATDFELATVSGSGDVSKVGTPVNNQVGVWTGDGTLEGDTALTFDTTTDTLGTLALNISGLTASRVVQTDASKNLESSSVTTTELGYLSGVTSAIQTQFSTKQAILSGASLTGVTVATDDKILIQDTSDSNNLKTVTAQSIADLASGGAANNPAVNTSDVATTTNVLSDVTGLTKTVESGKTYAFKVTGFFNTAVVGTGLQLAMNGPTTSSIYINGEIGSNATGGKLYGKVTAWDTVIPGVTGPDDATTANAAYFVLQGTFTTTAAGTVAVRYKSEVDTSQVQILTGAQFFIYDITP